MADENIAPRALPHDIQAEMGVLGSMLLSPDAIFLSRERLDRNSFYKLAHQDIFSGILNLADKRNTVDLILLRDELKNQDKLEDAGGVGYLQELMEAVPTSANVEYYIEIVHEHAVRRKLIETSTGILKSSYQDGQDVEALLDEAESDILSVRHMKEGSRFQDMRTVLLDLMPKIDERHQNPGQLTGIPTGFQDLDNITSGLQPGEFVVIAARPSVGKTTFALNFLHNVCLNERMPAALYSLEMRAEQIVSNILCMHLKLDTQDFRKGTLGDKEWDALEESIEDLASMPLYVDDLPAVRIGDLRARARRMKHQNDVSVIVVDYLQLVRPPHSRDNRAVEVAEISAGLKALARELNIPVVAVAQLNRSVEKEGRRPRMSDLRESGAIEQDADVIMLLHRPQDNEEGFDMSDPGNQRNDIPPSPAELIVAKQRNGPTGVCRLAFWKRWLRFGAASSQRQF
ncbi:MAG: replicative DNA helicase [Candidatus Brocadiia bacterium]